MSLIDVGNSRFGSFGRFGKKVVARALRFLIVRQAAIDGELQREIGSHRAILREMEERLAAASARIGAVQQSEQLIHESNAAVLQRAAESEAQVREALVGTRDRIDELAQRADAQWTETADAARRVEEITRRLDAADGEMQWLKSRLLATPYTSVPLETWAPSVRSEPGAFDYLGFEQIFRGPESLIRERQTVYLPFVRESAPVLDVGCGRGEFMEVVNAAGIEAVGIDTNAQMIAHCRSKGIANVRQADALSYLDAIAPGSLGAIFSAQVIEHLTPEDLLAFAAVALRRLRPGGAFIAETVNPNSIEAAKMFYVDSTHVKPLFPETVSFLCRSVGFSSVRIFYPNGSGFEESDPTSQNEFAVVATA